MRGVPVLDLGLSSVLLVASLGSILTGEVHEGPAGVTLPVAVVSSLVLVLRTRAAIVATLVVCVAETVQTLVAGESPGTLMALVITLVLAYSLAAEHDEGLATAGLALLLATNFFQEWHGHGTDYPFITLELGGAWLLGRAARTLRARATYAEQHQRDLARLAVSEERTRIARELHDVVAHALSVIAVQADAAEAALRKDPVRAADPLRAIRGSAREALSDMRQLLHVLRLDDADADPADARRPARGLEDLHQLVAGLREAGLPVEASWETHRDLPAGTELAVYRIAQEGLTNVLKHAGPVPTSLRVEDDDRGVRVVVRNAAGDGRRGAALSSGQGLIGVRERVLAAGGRLHAGPTPDGGFELVAELCRDGSLPAPTEDAVS